MSSQIESDIIAIYEYSNQTIIRHHQKWQRIIFTLINIKIWQR
ncbi:hypothetical protein [Nostoc sp. FACHB-110]|nr:hypothetical protein [Nostoc sp. FACHB-110]